jgi:hypothetical protein
MRFWFAAISPYYQSISAGNYTEFGEEWQRLKPNFSILLSNLLIRDLVTQRMAASHPDDTIPDDPIVSIGSYYDKHVRIEILAKHASGKVLAGACKYSQAKAKTNMPNTLKQQCERAQLPAEEYALFSQNGFTAEVLEQEGAQMHLLTERDMATLLAGLGEEDLLVYKNKKY